MASYGFVKAGWKGKWFVEIEDYPHQAFARHHPHMRGFYDVRDCGAGNLSRVDVIFGGFPCQDISVAGRQKGIRGKRSGLFFQFARIVGELRPKWWLFENSANITAGDSGRWLEAILSEMAALGYDATWHCLPACALGANHQRDRGWFIAKRRDMDDAASGGRQESSRENATKPLKNRQENRLSGQTGENEGTDYVCHTASATGGNPEKRDMERDSLDRQQRQKSANASGASGENVSDTNTRLRKTLTTERIGTDLGSGIQGNVGGQRRVSQPRLGRGSSDGPPTGLHGSSKLQITIGFGQSWPEEPDIPRLTTVKENRSKRVKAIGNGLLWHFPHMLALLINLIEQEEENAVT